MTLLAPVDVEGGIRTWLRSQANVTALVGTRVFFGLPVGVTFPAVTLARVGGGAQMQEGGGWIDTPVVSFSCWGTGEADKAGATAVALAVQQAISTLENTTLVAGVVALWGTVESVLYAPDLESARARVIVDASFGIRVA